MPTLATRRKFLATGVKILEELLGIGAIHTACRGLLG